MRYSGLSLFAAVSCVAILSLSAGAAAPPAAENFGTLKAQDQWRVGTIDDHGAPYCAMVNKYEKDVFLAFARDTDGFGSLALDFPKDMFTPGREYEVTLAPDAKKGSIFSAHASNERSVVVQIGKNEAFYDTLNKAASMHASMPVANVTFVMNSFGKSYQDLVDCAQHLKGGTPVAAAKSETKVAAAEIVPGKAPEDAIDWYDDKKDSLSESAAAEKPKNAERKLLASTSAPPSSPAMPADTPATSGLTAQELEKQQLAAIQQRPAADPVMSASKSATASTPLLIEKKAGDKSETMFSKPETAKSEPMPAVAPIPVANAALKTPEPRRVETKTVLSDESAPVTASKDNRSAALEQERDSLKRQLDEALAFNAMTTPDARKVAEMQATLAEKDAQYAALKKDLDAQQKISVPPAATVAAADPALDAKYKKLNDDLAQKQEAVSRMEEQMKQAEAARAAEAERSARAERDLEQAREQLAKIKKGDVPLAAEAAPMAKAPVMAMPAVPSMPVAQETIGAPPVQPNRAAAFLDRIMTYHRTGGSPPPVAAPVMPPKAAAAAPVVPAAPSAEENSFMAVLNAKPVVPAKAEAPAPKVADMLSKVAEQPPAAIPVENVTDKMDEPAPEMAVAPVVAPPAKMAVADLSVPPVMPPSVLPQAPKSDATLAKSSLPDTPPVVAVKSAPPRDEKKDILAATPSRTPLSVASLPIVPMEDAVPQKEDKKPAQISAAPVMSAPPAPAIAEPAVTPVAAAAPAPAPGPLTLESLLERAGGQKANFVVANAAPGEAVRQWKKGSIKGLYEQTADGGGNFSAAVQNYLDRYREDCPGHLNVTVGEARTMRAGMVAPSAIACALPSNSYSTSFVFVQDRGVFSAIGHTGRANDTAAVKSIGDKIVSVLSAADHFVTPEPTIKAPPPAPVAAPAVVNNVPPPAAVSAPEVLSDPSQVIRLQPPQAAVQPPKQLKFNLNPGKKAPGQEFPTVVIE